MSNPAGWFPQPDGQQRYWDGEQWTDHFAPLSAPALTPIAKPARRWFTKKRFILPPVALVFFVAGAGAGGTTAAPAVAPVAPVAPAAQVTNVAPAECGTALDLASQFATAVGTEHQEMSAAFTKAGQDNDYGAMAASIIAAENQVTGAMKTIEPQLTSANAVCRAAIK